MILEVHNTSDDDCNAASDQKMSIILNNGLNLFFFFFQMTFELQG